MVICCAQLGKGDGVEWTDDNARLLHDAYISWPRLRRTELYSRSEEVISRRIDGYLHASGLPMAAACPSLQGMQSEQGDARDVFLHLRSLISESRQDDVEDRSSHTADPTTLARLAAWLEPGEAPCPPWLKHLFDGPLVSRQSMVPENWGK